MIQKYIFKDILFGRIKYCISSNAHIKNKGIFNIGNSNMLINYFMHKLLVLQKSHINKKCYCSWIIADLEHFMHKT